MRPTSPAVAVAGDAIGRETALEAFPESLTEMAALPGSAISELETSATKSVLSPKVVGRELPFHRTIDEVVKPAPLTRSVNEPWPAMAYGKLSELLPG